MIVITTRKELASFVDKVNLESLGFVPTMGALHAGHKSLIDRSVSENISTIVSIFVNPTQFLPHEDLSKYPRTLERDLELCESAGVDCVFAPDEREIYPLKNCELDYKISPPSSLTNCFEGSVRPGHFDGVCGVVLRFLNLISPSCAYFGAKDFQQLLVIKHMARSLFLRAQIVACETIREDDGLALSSRNAYLSPASRTKALALYNALCNIKNEVAIGVLEKELLLESSRKFLADIELDYFEIVDFNLAPIDRVSLGQSVALIAGRVSGDESSPRLLDNFWL